MFETYPRILIIEDNPDHAELIIRSLEVTDYDISLYHVSDGEEALDFLFRKNEYKTLTKDDMPNLILLDLKLPKLDGFEVLKTIKNTDSLRHIPVIVLTTSNMDTDIQKAYDLQANSYLVKPINFTLFITLMEEFGSYWLEHNVRPLSDNGKG
ncbi:MAG: response regulator [Candidatus Auribacter fodinae]|jgi:CheY-like chemotaxis protein|uniref:Response regulator n=1 Tax=Candidatus Auribacter fodinae TaxID=2093366 RepID=A0A3A4R616_9BACT|nr:MAG: response regulator [Candidatus Auribacter fodinae]